jgi:hypothetical protein
MSAAYAFYPVSGGTALGAYEPTGVFSVVGCPVGEIGTTTVYRLIKGSRVLYTISVVERNKAVSNGFTATTLGRNFCIDLPTDSPLSIRILSIPHEFENRSAVKY